MASIRRHEIKGTLFMDFRYAGIRLREYTDLPDNLANRKRLQKALDKIETDIALGTFDYEKTFGKSLPQRDAKDAPIPESVRQSLIKERFRHRSESDTPQGLHEQKLWAQVPTLTPALIDRLGRVSERGQLAGVPMNDSMFRHWLRLRLPGKATKHLRLTPPSAVGTADTMKTIGLTDWSPASVNANVDLLKVVEGIKRTGSARIALCGVPGTGKTAFAKSLARMLDKPLLEQRASDLLSAYVGETEQRIGEDSRGVLVMTCHAMAMRLVGASFAKKSDMSQGDVFKQVLLDSIALLKGEGLPPDEADDQRDRLLAGFRRILVDEYQDIGQEQYELISALAGRNRRDEEGRNTLFAVGDDDQNIYAFNGASVRFIRQFEADYDARPTFLIENYRSTGHIVGASNAVIAPGVGRMKVEHPIEVNRARQREAHGGVWAQRDNVAQGRVQLLAVRNLNDELEIGQAAVLMGEFERLRQIDGDWQWSDCAVIAREWRYLDAVRAWCELHQVPVQVANEDSINVWRLRETQELVKWVRAKSAKQLDLSDLSAWIAGHESNTWWQLLNEAIDAYRIEVSGQEFPGTHLVDWLAEWGREVRRKQTGILLLTAHRAKGLEFRHVGVIDGGWDHDGRGSDPDETRRLFYVAMTRAKQTLVLVQVGARHRYSRELEANSHVQQREVHAGAMAMEYGRRFVIPSLREIDIGYAGRFSPSHRVHREIAGLRVGDPVELAHAHGKWVLMAQNGFEVGRMSRAFEQPRGKHFVSAKVLAIQSRNIGMVDDEFKKLVKVDEWEVVLPELVFA